MLPSQDSCFGEILLNVQRLLISTLICVCPSSFIPGNLILSLSDYPLSLVVTADGKQLLNMPFALLSSSVWLTILSPKEATALLLVFFSFCIDRIKINNLYASQLLNLLSVNSILSFLRFFILTRVLLYFLFPSFLYPFKPNLPLFLSLVETSHWCKFRRNEVQLICNSRDTKEKCWKISPSYSRSLSHPVPWRQAGLLISFYPSVYLPCCF